MFKKTITILLLLLCLISCNENTSDDSEIKTSATVSQWRGLETVKHPPNDYKLDGYLRLWELSGTPDPTPPEGYEKKEIDFTNIICKTDKEVYSLSDMGFVYVNVNYVQTSSAQQDSIELDHYVNIERWNGETWDRLIHIDPEWWLDAPFTEPHIIQPGESEHEALLLDHVYTALYPGKYRLVAYINYEPVYAEFELIE